MGEAQRRVLGGDGFFFLFPPSEKLTRAGLVQLHCCQVQRRVMRREFKRLVGYNHLCIKQDVLLSL
jgi:hypothetical protein